MHALIKTLIVAGIGVFAIVLWGFAAASSKAADCQSYERVLGAEQVVGADVHTIPADKLPKIITDLELLTGLPLDEVTRGFLVVDGVDLTFGFEIGGCLMPALHIHMTPAIGA